MADKKSATRYLKMAVPFIRLGAEELADLDENDTGTDDLAAAAINLAADVIDSVAKGKPLPAAIVALLKVPRE